MDNLLMPYAVRWYFMSRYWYYVGTEHRQTGVSSPFHRHHLPAGAYQVLGTTLAGRGARIEVVGNDTETSFKYVLVPSGEEGKERSGVATIHVPTGGGYIQCTPIDQSGADRPEDALSTPLVMQLFPLEPYKP